MKVIAVRDIKADLWFNPIFAPSAGQIIRWFGDECTNPSDQTPFHKHPEDYELYIIGEWDETKGTITPKDKEQIAVGSNFKK